jgi:YfiH family protein
VRVADCAPILIADARRAVVAAVHAGWRGTAAGVAGAAVTALEREFGCAARNLIAAIGPLIRVCCYEVGLSTRQAFTQREADRWFSPGRGDRLQLDVAAACRDQLEAAGVPRDQIHDSGLCTACHLDTFFSYRKEGSGAGRLFAGIRPAR